MDRLDTWNHRNGQPIDKAKTVALYAMVATGFVAGVVASCALNSGNDKNSNPFPLWDDPYAPTYGQ